MRQQIKVNDITNNMPEVKALKGSKTLAISEYLITWIKNRLKDKTIRPSYLMPQKAMLAEALGVSIGTIQNVYRKLEDNGVVQSKQCVGTMITDTSSSDVKKLTSKREIAIELIKTFIMKNKFKAGEELPSARAISKYISKSVNTTRLAIENLITNDVIEQKGQQLFLKTLKFNITEIDNLTLVNKIEEELKNYILENLEISDKMPSHAELAKIFNVSPKTIHDGLEVLKKEGILLARRGRYGTSVVKMPNQGDFQLRPKLSMFAPAQQTALYHYERIQNDIKALISEKYPVGSKLPSIIELAKMMDVSPNTIRKAFYNLASDGYLTFSRGRYGGTFVADIPKNTSSQSFEWLAINPKYAEYQN